MAWAPSLSKRSQSVSLTLVAGAGIAAMALGRHDPSQREDDMLIYQTLVACRDAGLRSVADCDAADREAHRLYPGVAPRYPSLAACEAHHGCGGCLDGTAVSSDAAGRFVPSLSGFMLARRPDEDRPAQPLFRHADRGCGPARGGMVSSHGYCTASGGRVWGPSDGSGVAKVSSVLTRTVGSANAPRVVASGGFGGTGHAVSGGHGGGGS
ncbi:DUF1190 domain-containing protein [uncultured Methylobacterium sp.]|jgi:uncharacterized protein YgiB involved in biofilm formation|uniref:DUF1190 domain-containing protein n=1 Tax=uncultured Methylobacterium sp. TaxID=157278 RepID=UPI00263928DA|nr:DUF1190 domain-containing protein [uncultured Methylobacterium sp.]